MGSVKHLASFDIGVKNMQIRVKAEWLKACGYEHKSPLFEVISVRDFGPGRKMYEVLDGNRGWVVWEIRVDEVIE
jgi:hypothetical protein